MHTIFKCRHIRIYTHTTQQRGLSWGNGWQCTGSRCTKPPWFYHDKYWRSHLSRV